MAVRRSESPEIPPWRVYQEYVAESAGADADLEEGAASFPFRRRVGIDLNALVGTLLWVPVRGRNRCVPGRRCRCRGRDLAFLQGPARLLPASGLRAAGDDARSRGRRFAARRIRQGASPLSADPGRAEAR